MTTEDISKIYSSIIINEGKEKGNLNKLLNKEGFLLEYQLVTKLKQISAISNIDSNHSFKLWGRDYEIDCISKLSDFNLIIDCKKTSYSWIFYHENKSINKLNILIRNTYSFNSNYINFPIMPNTKIDYDHINCFVDKDKIKVVNNLLAVEFDDNKTPMYSNSQKRFTQIQNSRRDIDENLLQIITNLEGFVCFKEDELSDGYIIPIIVTTAELLIANFNSESITKDSSLNESDIYFENAKFLAVNFDKAIKLPSSSDIIGINPYYYDYSKKTIFIVNVKYIDLFVNFLEKIEPEIVKYFELFIKEQNSISEE